MKPSKTTDDDAVTGLPLLRSWRSVYLLVAAAFVFWVTALSLLPGLFS